MCICIESVLVAFFDADRFFLGAFDLATCGEALVAQDAQGLDFRALAAALAELEHLDIARTGQAIFVGGFFPFGKWPPKHQQFANVLNRCRVQFVGQGLKHGFACDAVVRENTHLDQAVGVQGGFRFFFNGGGQAIAADHDHWVEVVGVGPMGFALGWGQ